MKKTFINAIVTYFDDRSLSTEQLINSYIRNDCAMRSKSTVEDIIDMVEYTKRIYDEVEHTIPEIENKKTHFFHFENIANSLGSVFLKLIKVLCINSFMSKPNKCIFVKMH